MADKKKENWAKYAQKIKNKKQGKKENAQKTNFGQDTNP